MRYPRRKPYDLRPRWNQKRPPEDPNDVWKALLGVLLFIGMGLALGIVAGTWP